jgi:pimeloyl-ACP methyl ester carboxylesterase
VRGRAEPDGNQWPAFIALLAGVVLVAGCGGRATPTTAAVPLTSAPRSAVETCPSAGPGWRALRTTGTYRPTAARRGSGPLAVVFANDSTNDTCAWGRAARALAERGYLVAVFETAGNWGYEAPQVREVAAALRRLGARRIALVGASVGARAVLEVAAQRPRYLVGVVALSAERRVLPAYPGDLLPIGRRVRVPALSIGSRQDALTAFGRDTRAWDRTIPDDRALIVGGDDHGVELLAHRHGRRVLAAVLAFLRARS